MILENKHHICLLAAALTAGILLAGEHPSVQHVFPAVLLLFACAAGLYKKHPSREQIVMLFLVTGFCLLGAGHPAASDILYRTSENHFVHCTGYTLRNCNRQRNQI